LTYWKSPEGIHFFSQDINNSHFKRREPFALNANCSLSAQRMTIEAERKKLKAQTKKVKAEKLN
jgi:hypothetical protein